MILLLLGCSNTISSKEISSKEAEDIAIKKAIENAQKKLYEKAQIKIQTNNKQPDKITEEILEIIWKN